MDPLTIEGDRVLDGREAVYWLRRERTYTAVDYRRADGGAGTLRCFDGPTHLADARAMLERKARQ